VVPAGTRVVVLDTALASLPVSEADLGLPWNWRIGPASKPVSPDGSTFHDALKIDRRSGRVELPEPLVLPALPAAPDPPPADKLAVYARDRAGAGWLDLQRPSGRYFPMQRHFGVNRIATWAPSSGATVNTNGMPRSAVGTVATPTLTTTNLSTSMRRWRVPYLETLRWVFIALALIGVAIAILARIDDWKRGQR